MSDLLENDGHSKLLLEFIRICNIPCSSIKDLDGLQIPREILLNDSTYDEAKKCIPEFKKKFSSSYLTSLQSGAEKNQKWPLLNLLRQILKIYKLNLTPKRLANGYSKTGKKLYRRIFCVEKINQPPQ
tara:strand:- start:875 stop:1258 length:384 start_codon:yes stop_codon:yes gene_type:complete